MKKPVIRRALADRDIETAVDHYAREAGETVATKFVDALERSFDALAERPAAGSPRWAHELDLPRLRSWRVKRFPFLVFYLELADHIDVWRVLHAHADIPAWMLEPDDE